MSTKKKSAPTSSASNLIRRALVKKKKDFRGFSMRWMASQLGISHVYLSHIVRGIRPIPIALIEPICKILDLDDIAKAKIQGEAFKAKGIRTPSVSAKLSDQMDKDWKLVSIKDFDLLGRWEPIAILVSTYLDEYDGSAAFIAEKLRLPKSFVASVMELMSQKGFLIMKNGKLSASDTFYEFQSRSSRTQLRAHHRAILSKARDYLAADASEESFDRRFINSAVFTCAKADLPKLKNKISEFMREYIHEAAGSSQADEVYQLSVQFFPMTNLPKP